MESLTNTTMESFTKLGVIGSSLKNEEELDYTYPQFDDTVLPQFDPNPSINVTKDQFEEWCKPWKSTALIVKSLLKTFGFKAMDRWIQRNWARNGDVRVSSLDHDFFIVRFGSEGDYNHALFKGPWIVADHFLSVQRWRPLFIPSEDSVAKIVGWVRVHGLPLELHNQTFLTRVGEKLGVVLRVEGVFSSGHSTGKFARICVEMDLRGKLVRRSVTALGREFRLEYEEGIQTEEKNNIVSVKVHTKRRNLLNQKTIKIVFVMKLAKKKNDRKSSNIDYSLDDLDSDEERILQY